MRTTRGARGTATSAYFTEIPAGRINQLAADGSVHLLAQIDTDRLHSSQQLSEDLSMCLLVVRNQLVMYDVDEKREAACFDLHSRRLNPQFVSLVPTEY